MEPLTLIQFVVGPVVLTAGAEVFVRSASSLASALGISSLVIGLTVVAFGTGSPKLAVVLQAAFEGQADIAIGNVDGEAGDGRRACVARGAVIVTLPELA